MKARRPLTAVERRVVAVWRKTLGPGTIVTYLLCVRRFQKYCRVAHLNELEELTYVGATRFADKRAGTGPKHEAPLHARQGARNPLNAWAHALRSLGTAVPEWRQPPNPDSLPAVLRDYLAYRREHGGVGDWTLRFDIETATWFRKLLRSRGRKLARIRVAEVDAFIMDLARRLREKALASRCSSLRSFLKFLHVTGRVKRDLAAIVARPRMPRLERPPRALPALQIQHLLESSRQCGRSKKRDYALLLLMATYGLGGAEACSLRLEDLDWSAGTMSVRRPKTGSVSVLPVLPPVAKAVSDYLRRERPQSAVARKIFVSRHLPHRPLTTSAIRSIVRKSAKIAGISAPMLGANIMRHSHACHQVETGANVKVVGEILGHRDPSSTSAYVRVAIKTLRNVAIEVPVP